MDKNKFNKQIFNLGLMDPMVPNVYQTQWYLLRVNKTCTYGTVHFVKSIEQSRTVILTKSLNLNLIVPLLLMSNLLVF